MIKLIKHQDGFTLLELLVTLTVVAIVTTLAVPAFEETLARSKMTSNVNLMVGAINYARSEAIKLGAEVVVQPHPTGWEVVSGGNVLRTFQPPSRDVTITTSLANITFAANGYRKRVAGLSQETLKICSSSSNGRLITLSVGGSLSVGDAVCP